MKLAGHLKRYTIIHIAVYLAVGITAMLLLDYKEVFMSDPYFNHFRALDSPIVRAAVLFQFVRAVLIGLILYPIHELITSKSYGWLYLFFLLFGLTSVLSITAAPGSIEGFIYTDVSIAAHLIGMPEIIIQTLLISLLYWKWQRRASS